MLHVVVCSQQELLCSLLQLYHLLGQVSWLKQQACAPVLARVVLIDDSSQLDTHHAPK